MQIIKIGICVDNNDPKGLNRIRYSEYNEGSNKESFLKYQPWDDNDPFIAGPFLPTNINHVPSVSQSVRIISYDTDKTLVNIEYIAGPFSTNYDYESQTFSQQTSSLTFGQAIVGFMLTKVLLSELKYIFDDTPVAVAVPNKELLKEKDILNYFLKLNTSGKPMDVAHLNKIEKQFKELV